MRAKDQSAGHFFPFTLSRHLSHIPDVFIRLDSMVYWLGTWEQRLDWEAKTISVWHQWHLAALTGVLTIWAKWIYWWLPRSIHNPAWTSSYIPNRITGSMTLSTRSDAGLWCIDLEVGGKVRWQRSEVLMQDYLLNWPCFPIDFSSLTKLLVCGPDNAHRTAEEPFHHFPRPRPWTTGVLTWKLVGRSDIHCYSCTWG